MNGTTLNITAIVLLIAGSIIIYGLFLFGKIVWAFLEMLIQALGQL